MRTTAELEERRMYTHYEGWMPEDEEEWPSNVWRARWCKSSLLRDTHPRSALNFSLPSQAVRIEDHPSYDPDDATVRSRALNRG